MSSYRQRVIRADGRTLNIVQHRAHLSYCFTGCCCGRTDRGYAEVPVDVYKEEWTRRKIRNAVHLTKGDASAPACSPTLLAWYLMASRSGFTPSIAPGKCGRFSTTSTPCCKPIDS
jgi:hypothetical protein